MGEKIEELGIEKEAGWLYYVKRSGNTLSVYRSKMNREGGGGMDNPQKEEIATTDIEPDYEEFIYYVDGDGDLAKAERTQA